MDDELDDIEEVEEVEEATKKEKIDKKEEKKSHKVLNTFIVLFIIVVLIFAYSKYIGTKGLIVKEYRVESKVLTDNFSGVKIVHFSDLLYKSTFNKEDLKELVKRINILKPNIIVFTGDLTNKSIKLNDNDKEYIISELSLLNADIGKYAIYGDQDYSNEDYEDIMKKSNFKILDNSYEEIYYKTNEPMYLVGLPSSIKETVSVEEAFDFYDDLDRKFITVLVHDGDTIKYIDDSTYEVDLILGGHSLNGSVVIPYIGGIINEGNTYKYSGEESIKGITKIYISSGLGTNRYGYRFLNKPSFNLYRLKAQSN